MENSGAAAASGTVASTGRMGVVIPELTGVGGIWRLPGSGVQLLAVSSMNLVMGNQSGGSSASVRTP